MAVAAILFDKDGTLIDFAATFEPATHDVLEIVCKADPDTIRLAADAIDYDLESGRIRPSSPVVAGTSLDLVEHLADVLDIREDAKPAMAAEVDRLYGEACVSTVTALPGVADTLKQLQLAGYGLGVATNDAEANARSQMKRLGLSRYFESFLGADSGFGAKPAPGMILAFADALALKPSQVLMVGDSLHDLEAGRMAGAQTCAVLTGLAPRGELEPHADRVLLSVAELPAWLERQS